MAKAKSASSGKTTTGSSKAGGDATSNLPAKTKAGLPMMKDAPVNDTFAQFANEGMENITAQDIIIPRIGILQALSPQLDRTKPQYIDGAKMGMMCDLASGEIIGDTVTFVPVYFNKLWLEWAPRSTGRGLQGIHHTPDILDQCERDDKGKAIRSNGNVVNEMANFYGYCLELNWRPSFIPFGSTQLKKGKKWNTLATGEKWVDGHGRSYVPPLYCRAYILTGVPESNAQGNWIGWKIERGPTLDTLVDGDKGRVSSLISECRAFLNNLRSGKARMDDSSFTREDPHSGTTIDADGAM